MTMHFAHAPHQGAPGPVGAAAPNAALLIDFDNVTMGMRSDLSKDLKKLLQSDIIRGKVTVQRAYADWRRYPQYIVPLSEASIDLIFAPAYGSSKKNATDIRMAIDAVELVFVRPEIGTFILLTGDSDFSSLVLKLKEYGKYVIGVGIQESSSDILVQNCDEYYSYTSITGLRKTAESDLQAVDPWVLVERAVKKMADRKDVMRSDRLKQVMLEIDPGFDEGNFGYSKFSRFLTEAASKDLVALKRLDNGQYEVGTKGSSISDASERRGRGSRSGDGRKGRSNRRPTRDRRPDETEAQASDSDSATDDAPGRPLEEAYTLLRRAIVELADREGEGVRDSDVKRRMLHVDRSFDEAELGFTKFSEFLRQAAEHDVVALTMQDGGNYEVALVLDEGGVAPSRTSEPGAGRADRGRDETSREASESARGERPEATVEASDPSGSSDVQVVVAESRPVASSGLRRGSTRRRGGQGDPPLLEGQVVTVPSTTPAANVGSGEAEREGSASHEGARSPAGRVDARALGLPTDTGAQIRYMTHRYRGVGQKTAESIVDAFGTNVFDVLQFDPDRVKDVVPAARAELVIEAWKADYARRTQQRSDERTKASAGEAGNNGG